MNINSIKKNEVIKKGRLDEATYFLSFIQEAYDNQLLSDKMLEDIQNQGVQLLANQTKAFTRGESSSVRIEVAQGIMNSIFYSISIYLKSISDTDEVLSLVTKTSICDLYKMGKQLIDKQIDKTKKLYKSIQLNCIKTENLAYKETLSGISEFFSFYNPEYAAQETPGYIDYPLSIVNINLTGIEYVNSYIKNLYLENEFCQKFSFENIENVLLGYDIHYKNILINIFQRVLTNALGCLISNKKAVELNINTLDFELIKNKLNNITQIELYQLLIDLELQLFKELSIKKSDLKLYITDSIKEIAIRLYAANENNTLEKEFVSFIKYDQNEMFQFQDGIKMEDETFREIADKIRDCENVADKLALIKNSVNSIIDLVDILEGSCLFDSEFTDLFDFLQTPELAMLVKLLPSEMENTTFEFVESEKEWHLMLEAFIKNLSDKDRNEVLNLSEKIIFNC